ncbi:MAG: hypothetical protein GXP13_03680 [Gammaproteobacteria bacterium]|nr:hypothetical protein [Gammaproteobacteria bacterium]
MKSVFNNIVFLFILLAAGTINADGFQGDKKDLPSLNNLINVLNVQRQELQRLVDMLTRLETWKASLTQDNIKLSGEREQLKSDKDKIEKGTMTNSDFNKKWNVSGRLSSHDKAVGSFQEDVKKFNIFAKDYNELTVKMKHVLDKRSPQQVMRLIKEMRHLVSNMQAALKAGDIVKAKFMAKQSYAAAEFGYVAN